MLDSQGLLFLNQAGFIRFLYIMEDNIKKKSYLIEIEGIVQGVGFRPFIYALAGRLGIAGTVSNTTEGVVIKAGNLSHIELLDFIKNIREKSPAPSVIENISFKETGQNKYRGFIIAKSTKTENRFQLISPDIAMCKKCIEDIFNADDTRRYLYPFTNCTNCGPRFTIIKKMPYDRPYTTMDKFKMCGRCMSEYCDPSDRRFHAQPNACKDCGPKLLLIDRTGNTFCSKDPIKRAAELISKGEIIGIKSLGGFQIACDAASKKTVEKLRKRKSRPAKPFAIMIGDIEWIRKYYRLSLEETDSLISAKAPIVLLRKNNSSYPLSHPVSFDNKYEGIMLPYTPIHHILFKYIAGPLVMTSGNISEEPIASGNDDAKERLKNICDYYLMHNRDIYSRYDDSVIRIFMDKEMILRRARGYAPYPIKISGHSGSKSVLATGAQEKNTFTILTRKYAISSQHIGDLDTYQSLEFFEDTLKNYKSLFGLDDFDIVAHDMHPDYRSTKIALNSVRNSNMLFPVQHHMAHIASVIAENNLECPLIGFAWDGTGYGIDGKIWGSEIFEVSSNLDFTRIAHLIEKALPGAAATINKPYRMAAVYLKQLYERSNNNESLNDYIYNNMTYGPVKIEEIDAICSQIETDFNSPMTTSMGRLFDAVSSILGCTHISTFEGEAAISLEMAIEEKYIDNMFKSNFKTIEKKYRYDTIIKKSGERLIIDDFDIFRQILDDRENGISKGLISFKFHNTLAFIVLDISMDHKISKKIKNIALSGGVFQNNYLLRLCYALLSNNNFNVYTNLKVPVNDGGISLGQAYFAAVKNNLIRKGEKHHVSGNSC